MSAKDLFIDFINSVFIIVIVGVAIIFFIDPDRFAAFTNIIKSLAPIAFFLLVLLIKFRFNRQQYKKRKNNNNLDIVLHLTYWDRMISDFIVYGTPILICGFAFFINQQVGFFDIAIAVLVFLILYFWQRYLFGKQR